MITFPHHLKDDGAEWTFGGLESGPKAIFKGHRDTTEFEYHCAKNWVVGNSALSTAVPTQPPWCIATSTSCVRTLILYSSEDNVYFSSAVSYSFATSDTEVAPVSRMLFAMSAFVH